MLMHSCGRKLYFGGRDLGIRGRHLLLHTISMHLVHESADPGGNKMIN